MKFYLHSYTETIGSTTQKVFEYNIADLGFSYT